jgi:PadR family transcriptional regulator PadR
MSPQGRSQAFDIVRVLSNAGELLTSEGTIYPLLARLRKERLVTTRWRESDAGPPRRYYRLSAAGRQALGTFGGEWSRSRDAVDALLVGPNQEGAAGAPPSQHSGTAIHGPNRGPRPTRGSGSPTRWVRDSHRGIPAR